MVHINIFHKMSYNNEKLRCYSFATINQNTGEHQHPIWDLVLKWFSVYKEIFVKWTWGWKNLTWTRIWSGLQCAVNTLVLTTPRRIYLISNNTLHSVIYPSYKSTDRNPASRMCLWFNQLKQMISSSRLLQNPGETSLMTRRRKTTQCTSASMLQHQHTPGD